MRTLKYCLSSFIYFLILSIYLYIAKGELSAYSFYYGVTKNNNFFTEILFLGVIFFILIIFADDIKKKISSHLYIYVVNSNKKRVFNLLLKDYLINIIILFSSLAIYIFLFIDNNYIYLLLETGLLIISVLNVVMIMLFLNFKFNFNFSLILVCVLITVLTIISGRLYSTEFESLVKFFPFNQTMYFRQTESWAISYIVSIIYFIIIYVFGVLRLKKIDVI